MSLAPLQMQELILIIAIVSITIFALLAAGIIYLRKTRGLPAPRLLCAINLKAIEKRSVAGFVHPVDCLL